MEAFFKRNGAWLLLAVVMLALLISLPYIELDLKTGVVFTIHLENRASIGIDGLRLKWTLGSQEDVTDAFNHIDLVKSPLKPGSRMSIEFTRKMLNGRHRLPERFHADVAVLDLLNDVPHEIVVDGTMDLNAADEGEYVFYLEGSPGAYTIRMGD